MPVLVAVDTGDVLSKNATCPPFVRGCTYTSYCSSGYNTRDYGVSVKWTDNSVSWYASDNSTQMSSNGTTYYYVAITV